MHNSLSDNIITYDDYGNMTFDGKHKYGYNANGRLIDIDDGTVTYDYDAFGRLAISTDSTESTYYYYDTAGRVIAEYSTFNDGSPLTQERTYIWGSGFNEILAMDEGTTSKYILTDSLGSVTAVYDAVAGTCAFTTYDSYGNSDTAPASPYGYAGMRYSAELDGYITPNRAYTPATGRFLQPDPLGTTPNPQTGNAYAPLTQYNDGANIYAYVNNNAITGTDALGLYGGTTPWDPWDPSPYNPDPGFYKPPFDDDYADILPVSPDVKDFVRQNTKAIWNKSCIKEYHIYGHGMSNETEEPYKHADPGIGVDDSVDINIGGHIPIGLLCCNSTIYLHNCYVGSNEKAMTLFKRN